MLSCNFSSSLLTLFHANFFVFSCTFSIYFVGFICDDAEKITSEPHGPHVLLTRTCTIQKLKTLRGVPVWYRPNTLRRSSQRNLLFTTLEYQSWGELCLPWFVRVLVFLQQQGLIPFSWSRSLFLIGVFLGVFCRILSIQESLLGVSQNVEGKSFPYTRKRDWQAILD